MSPPTTAARPSPAQAWLLASRPKTLPAAAAPVVVGSALAWQEGLFHLPAALAALLAALLIQIGTNFANDLYDWQKGADTEARLGPTRVTSAGLLPPATVARGMWLVFGLATLLGLYLVWRGGWPIVIIGVASILSGIAYTGGPYPLGYNGLGDLFVFLFFGLVAVAGTFYVQALSLIPAAFVAAIPVGALATNILVVNNVRDVDTDRVAGKRTLAVLLGRQAGVAEYALLTGLSYLAPLLMWARLGFGAAVLLPWLTLPLALPLVRAVATTRDGPSLNRTLAGTARLLMLFALLFALGILLASR